MMWFYLYIEWDDAKSTGAVENMPQSVDRLLETIKAQVVGSKAGAGFWVLGAGFRSGLRSEAGGYCGSEGDWWRESGRVSVGVVCGVVKEQVGRLLTGIWG